MSLDKWFLKLWITSFQYCALQPLPAYDTMSGMTPPHSTLSTATNKVAALEGNMRNILPVVILIFYSAFVLCEQMDWGENDYLVDEFDTIQGREHI